MAAATATATATAADELSERLSPELLGLDVCAYGRERVLLASRVAELGACPYCCMRVVGLEDPRIYAAPRAELGSVLRTVLRTERIDASPDTPCILCFGMMTEDLVLGSSLQHFGSAREMPLWERLVAAVDGSGFDTRAISLHIRQPASTPVRDHCALTYARRQHPELEPVLGPGGRLVPWSVVAAKDAIKGRILLQINRRKALQLALTAKLQVNLDFAHPETDREPWALLGREPPRDRRAPKRGRSDVRGPASAADEPERGETRRSDPSEGFDVENGESSGDEDDNDDDDEGVVATSSAEHGPSTSLASSLAHTSTSGHNSAGAASRTDYRGGSSRAEMRGGGRAADSHPARAQGRGRGASSRAGRRGMTRGFISRGGAAVVVAAAPSSDENRRSSNHASQTGGADRGASGHLQDPSEGKDDDDDTENEDQVAAESVATSAESAKVFVARRMINHEKMPRARAAEAVEGSLSSEKRPPTISPAPIAEVLRELARCSLNLPSSLQVPPAGVATRAVAEMALFRAPVYIRGRYTKLARGVSQSVWIIPGQEGLLHSVESDIGPLIQRAAKADAYRFHGAGREDVDVRMLGHGRPFVVELESARQSQLSVDELASLEQSINRASESIAISQLSMSDATAMDDIVHQGATTKRKEYVAVVWTSRPITAAELAASVDSQEELVIHQATPSALS